MTSNLPARTDEAPLAAGAAQDPGAASDRTRGAVQQNVAVGVLPLAIAAFLLLAFIAAAWTFLAALPAGG